MRMVPNGVGPDGRSIILDWATFYDAMALSNDSVFNMLAQMADSACDSLLYLGDYKLRLKASVHIIRLICQNLLVYCRRRLREIVILQLLMQFSLSVIQIIIYFLCYSRTVFWLHGQKKS